MSELNDRLQSFHPEYVAMADEWKKARDFASGIKAMRDHDLGRWSKGCASVVASSRDDGSEGAKRVAVDGTTFASIARNSYILPTSDRMTYNEYVLYLLRGHCPSYVRLTRAGYLGLVFANPPKVEAATAIKENADLNGTPLVEFIEDALCEVMTLGRYGVLLDVPPADTRGKSKGETERAGIRPYVAGYRAVDIVDWDDERINGRKIDTYFRLREAVRRGGNPDYNYRELVLEKGSYKQILYTREKLDEDYVGQEINPVRGGKPLDFIPFYLYSPRGGRKGIEQTPLADLIELQHEYYQWAVEFANACFAVGIPTPAFFGFTEDEVGNIVLGGMNAVWTSNTTGADAKYLEFTGQGLGPLAARGVAILTNIAKFGGRTLTQDKAAAEAAATVRIRASAESATLADMARSCSRITSQWLKAASEWGLGGGSIFELPTDYMDEAPDPALLKEMREAIAANIFALKDYVAYTKRINLVADSRTDDQVIADLEIQKEQGQAKADEATAARLAARVGSKAAAA